MSEVCTRYATRCDPAKWERDVSHHAEELRERLAKEWGGPGRYFFHRRLTQELIPELEIASRERLALRLRSVA